VTEEEHDGGTYKKNIFIDLIMEIGNFNIISGRGRRVAEKTKC
jgi:hypothetical protein